MPIKDAESIFLHPFLRRTLDESIFFVYNVGKIILREDVHSNESGN